MCFSARSAAVQDCSSVVRTTDWKLKAKTHSSIRLEVNVPLSMPCAPRRLHGAGLREYIKTEPAHCHTSAIYSNRTSWLCCTQLYRVGILPYTISDRIMRGIVEEMDKHARQQSSGVSDEVFLHLSVAFLLLAVVVREVFLLDPQPVEGTSPTTVQ